MSETTADASRRRRFPPAARYLALISFACLCYWAFLVADAPVATPTCTNLVPDVLRIAKENMPSAGPKIIDLVEEVESGSTNGGLNCHAIALMSNATKLPITYTRFQEYNKSWIKIAPGPSH